MKQGILVISEGTADPAGREDLRILIEEIGERFPDAAAMLAYTDETARKTLREAEGQKVRGIRAAMLKLKEDGVQSLAALTTEVLFSRAYEKEKEELHGCASLFSRMQIARPLIAGEDDLPLFVRCMTGVYGEKAKEKIPVAVVEKELRPETEAILPLLEDAMRKSLSPQAHVISLMGQKRTKKMLLELELQLAGQTAAPAAAEAIAERESGKTIIGFIPLAFLAGDAFRARLSEGDLSPAERTFSAGYEPHFLSEGLGAYDEFLRLYLRRLYEII